MYKTYWEIKLVVCGLLLVGIVSLSIFLYSSSLIDNGSKLNSNSNITATVEVTQTPPSVSCGTLCVALAGQNK